MFRLSLLKGERASIDAHIKSGAPVNGRDRSGRTALMIAAAAGREDICKALLGAGADPALIDLDGRTASELAAGSGHHLLATTLRPSDPADEISAVDTEPDTPPADDAGELWEAEPEFVRTLSNEGIAEHSVALQTTLSSFRTETKSDEWSEIEIQLPAAGRDHRADRSLPSSVTRLIRLAVARRRVDGRVISGAWPSASRRQLRLLRAALEMAGVVIEIVPHDLLYSTQVPPPGSDAEERQLARDTTELLLDLLAERTGAEYWVDTVRPFSPFDRDQEARCFSRLAEARRAVLRALVDCAGLLDNVKCPAAPSEVDAPDDPEETGDIPGESEPVDELAALRAVLAGPDILSRIEANDIPLPYGELANAIGKSGSSPEAEPVRKLRAALDRYRRARDRALEGGWKLVPWLARWYRNRGVPLADLIQEGNIGLLRAVDKFDLGRGARFSTYAVWWIPQSITRAIHDQSRVVRVPVHLGELARKVVRLSKTKRAELGREPDKRELAAALEISPVTVERAFAVSNMAFVEFDPDSAGESNDAPDREMDLAALKATITDVLLELPPRQERIVRMRFGIGIPEAQTLEQIGERFEVTRERIRQIEATAFRKLNHPTRLRRLQDFDDV